MSEATDDHLRRLPKVELHCHLEGAARAADHRRPGPAARRRPSRSTIPPSCSSSPASTSSSRSTTSSAPACARPTTSGGSPTRRSRTPSRAGVRYREMFFSPGFVIRLGVPVETVWEGIKAGVLDARHDLDINCRMILDFDKPTGPAHAMEMAAFAGSVADRDLLVGDRRRLGRAGHRPRRLRRRLHRGGAPRPAAHDPRRRGRPVRQHRHRHPRARLRADRPWLPPPRRPALTAEIVERQIPLDVCPTSNVMIANVVTSVADHPFARQREAGVLVTVNSDDPGMMRFDVADEYVAVARAYGYSLEDMEAISLAGIDACWAPDDEKQALRDPFPRRVRRVASRARATDPDERDTVDAPGNYDRRRAPARMWGGIMNARRQPPRSCCRRGRAMTGGAAPTRAPQRPRASSSAATCSRRAATTTTTAASGAGDDRRWHAARRHARTGHDRGDRRRRARPLDQLRLGFAYIGPINDNGWTQEHHRGRQPSSTPSATR